MEADPLKWRLPIAVVATIIVQTAAGVWWVAGLNNRVSNLEERLTEVQINALNNRVIAIEQHLRDMGWRNEDAKK